MAARVIYDPEGFENIVEDGQITGYRFRFKAQYDRGITLSILHDIRVIVNDIGFCLIYGYIKRRNWSLICACGN